MILRAAEVEDLSRFIESGAEGYDLVSDYFIENPHLLVATRFDEYIAVRRDNERIPGSSASIGCGWANIDRQLQSFYRKPGGQWLWLFGGDLDLEGGLSFHSPNSYVAAIREEEEFERNLEKSSYFNEPGFRLLAQIFEKTYKYALKIPYGELISELEAAVKNPSAERKYILSPALWTPTAQAREATRLQNATGNILKAIWDEKTELRSLPWYRLEELVAELLRDQGMEIHVVDEAPQGGRDIIARGELIPGSEPVTIAVEVKQKETVYRPDLSKALYDNRQFPALLFATAGRFSAGVIREHAREENQLRLFLKDGVALSDLIVQYGLRRGWTL